MKTDAMKAAYEQPKMTVIDMKVESHVLTGSTGGGTDDMGELQSVFDNISNKTIIDDSIYDTF